MNISFASTYKALGDESRLKILAYLKGEKRSCCPEVAPLEKGLCACDLEEELGLSQSVVSHHIKTLLLAGLINAEKRGRWMYYTRNEKRIKEIATCLLQ